MAKALLNDPEVLFLDEPTLGLDPDISIRLRAPIAALRRERGTTIILTTHYMREAEELCDEIAFIKAGRILAQGTADELKRQIRIGDVIALPLHPAAPPRGARRLFGRRGGARVRLPPPQRDHGPAERVLRLRADLLARCGDALPRPPDALPGPRPEAHCLHSRL